MSVVIHHNADCGTSRNVLAILRAAGTDPVVIDYLETGWTRPQLLALFAAAGLTPRSALRLTRSPAEELGLTRPDVTDAEVLDAMVAHPVLVNRPIVCTPRGVRLCRPSETVLDLLDTLPPRPLLKEDGEVILPTLDTGLSGRGVELATPQIDAASFAAIDRAKLLGPSVASVPPRILILYGSLRERSFSRLAAEEGARILTRLGAEVQMFDPSGLPLVDDRVDATHAKVRELRELTAWCDGMVWSSPERHGAMTGVLKTQIDWIPLSDGAVRPTQGKTLAVMQVSGGSQSFNAVNQMRILGRWMRMLTIPNQSSIPKAFQEFDHAGRMRPSPLYDRVVDVMEELVKFTLLTRDRKDYLVDRYSERKETAEALMARVDQTSAT